MSRISKPYAPMIFDLDERGGNNIAAQHHLSELLQFNPICGDSLLVLLVVVFVDTIYMCNSIYAYDM